MGSQLTSIVTALRRQASGHGGALRLDRDMTDILLHALDTIARRLDRLGTPAVAAVRANVIDLADYRPTAGRHRTTEGDPEGAA